jgi:acetylornithine deacetylase/succinyl-diaminopimelate desuccinylase-like protein
MADLIFQILEKRGYQMHKFETPGNPIIVAHIDGSSTKTLLFYNHYDVQPPEPLELWTTPPFEPDVREEALFARGAQDDKGEFLARLAAVEAVREANGGQLPCGVTFVVEGEEEIGSPHIAKFVKEHLDLVQADAAVWEEGGIGADGGLNNLLGVRGILAVELSVEAMSQDAHSGGAHVLPSGAWRLVWALNTLKDQNGKVLIDGFYDDAKPPSARDLELLAAMPSTEERSKEQYDFKEALGGLTGDEYKAGIFNPTCNIQGITTGYQGQGFKTVIPAQASAKLDFRLVVDQDPEDIFDKLRAHLDKHGFEDVQLQKSGMMWPVKVDPDDPFVQMTNRTAEEVFGKPSVSIPTTGGSSPVYAFKIPLGDIPVVRTGVRYWDNRAHAPNENVRLSDFLNGARHVARVLIEFAEM